MLAPMVGTVAWIASKSYYFQDKEWYDHQLVIIFHIRMQGMGQTRSDWKLWNPRKANNTGLTGKEQMRYNGYSSLSGIVTAE